MNIIRDGGIEIPESWVPTIKKHNNRKMVQPRTTEGTATRWNNGRIELQQSHPTFALWYKWCCVISRLHCLKKTTVYSVAVSSGNVMSKNRGRENRYQNFVCYTYQYIVEILSSKYKESCHIHFKIRLRFKGRNLSATSTCTCTHHIFVYMTVYVLHFSQDLIFITKIINEHVINLQWLCKKYRLCQ